jgi:hypothetical protein
MYVLKGITGGLPVAKRRKEREREYGNLVLENIFLILLLTIHISEF